MASEPGQTQKDIDHFGLDEQLLEELKEKAVAAKERAYCRCCFFYVPRLYQSMDEDFAFGQENTTTLVTMRICYSTLIRHTDPPSIKLFYLKVSKIQNHCKKTHTLFSFSFMEPFQVPSCSLLHQCISPSTSPHHYYSSRSYPVLPYLHDIKPTIQHPIN